MTTWGVNSGSWMQRLPRSEADAAALSKPTFAQPGDAVEVALGLDAAGVFISIHMTR